LFCYIFESQNVKKLNRVHFISIGGSVMHSLAIALKQKEYNVTGSDDQIYDPSKSKLEAHGLLPSSVGWDASRITPDIEAVIVGMHALPGNPELEKAKELGIKLYSYPEFIRLQSANKQRVVISGSHGKTTITAMVIHVLNHAKREFDYVIGAKTEGIDNEVKLTDAPVIIIEGDEYFCSPVDKTPKFLKYEHHIGLISGISWDHINAYPTFEEYVQQFDTFADSTPKAGSIAYCSDDNLTMVIGTKEREDVNQLEYSTHPYYVEDGKTFLKTEFGNIPLKIFGRHNLQNISGAMAVLSRIGISDKTFYDAIQSFQGASKRLQKLADLDHTVVFTDYAHAPSKVAATTSATKNQYADRRLVACLELHTYSSLNADFIDQYQDTLSDADEAFVFVNPDNLKNKNQSIIDKETIEKAFQHDRLHVTYDINEMIEMLTQRQWHNTNLLLMSSGNFAGTDMKALVNKINNQKH